MPPQGTIDRSASRKADTGAASPFGEAAALRVGYAGIR